jgi:hypothetical protein
MMSQTGDTALKVIGSGGINIITEDNGNPLPSAQVLGEEIGWIPLKSSTKHSAS